MSSNETLNETVKERKKNVLDHNLAIEERLLHIQFLYNLGLAHHSAVKRVQDALFQIGDENSGAPLELREEARRAASRLWSRL